MSKDYTRKRAEEWTCRSYINFHALSSAMCARDSRRERERDGTCGGQLIPIFIFY